VTLSSKRNPRGKKWHEVKAKRRWRKSSWTSRKDRLSRSQEVHLRLRNTSLRRRLRVPAKRRRA